MYGMLSRLALTGATCDAPTSPTRSPFFTSHVTPRSTCWFLNVMLMFSSLMPELMVEAPAAPLPPPLPLPPPPFLPFLPPLPLPLGAAAGACRLTHDAASQHMQNKCSRRTCDASMQDGTRREVGYHEAPLWRLLHTGAAPASA
jgi:hypothetical protein